MGLSIQVREVFRALLAFKNVHITRQLQLSNSLQDHSIAPSPVPDKAQQVYLLLNRLHILFINHNQASESSQSRELR